MCQTGETHMRGRDKGFTLIELIVTVAIIAIFSGVVLTFVGTGAHSYRATSGNAKVQMETQDVMDQIQNIIIDVNRSVYYSYGDGMNENVGELVMNDVDTNGDATAKTFFACSGTATDNLDDEGNRLYNYNCDVILWNKQDQKLYYARRNWEGIEVAENTNATKTTNDTSETELDSRDDSKRSNTESPMDITDDDMEVADSSDEEDGNTTVLKRASKIENPVESTLLAENITDFRVDISKAASERIVRFQFTANVNGKETTTVHSVNLRNQVQISKPYDGYNKSDSDTPWILLTNYPTEVEPGKSVTGFSKLMNGKINPDTVRWVVDSGKGAFTAGAEGASDSAVTLTANSDAVDGDIITVHVEAQTMDGKKVVSKTGTIKVANKKVPVELVPSVTDVLLGVGNSYDLTSIKWKIKYDDGLMSEELPGSSLRWKELSGKTGVIFNSGKIDVGMNAAVSEDTSNFDLKVTYPNPDNPGSTLQGVIHVKLARIDIFPTDKEYEVGAEKAFKYEYKEGGEVKNEKLEKKISNQWSSFRYFSDSVEKEFSQDVQFTIADVGTWKVKTPSISMNELGGFGGGTISAERDFKVKAAIQDKIIKINGDVDTIVAGKSYHCSLYNQEHIYVDVNREEGEYQYKIVWNIKNASEPDTGFANGSKTATVEGLVKGDNNNIDAILGVSKNEHGFELTADVEIYNDRNEVVKKYYAVKNIKVLTDIEIKNTFEFPNSNEFKVIKGRTYSVEAVAWIWNYDASNGSHVRSEFNVAQNEYEWKGIDCQNGKWYVRPNTGEEVEVIIWLTNSGTIPRVFNPDCKRLSYSKKIEVLEPEHKIYIKDSDNMSSREIYPLQEVELNAIILLDGKEHNASNLTWKCVYNNAEKNECLKNVNSCKKVFSLPQNLSDTGEYTVTAIWSDNGHEYQSNSYTVTVKDMARILAVNNKTSIFSGDTTDLYLSLQDNKAVYDASVDWMISDNDKKFLSTNNYRQQNIFLDGKENPLKFIATSNINEIKNITVTAKYYLGEKYGKKEGTASIVITITPLKMVLNSSVTQMYYGMDAANIKARVYDASKNEEVTDQYQIRWGISPEDMAYELSSDEGSNTNFKVVSNPTNSRNVTVTATAYDDNNIACSASTQITINNKKTKEIIYHCSAAQNQKLNFDREDEEKEIISLSYSYVTAGGLTIQCEKNNIPTLSVSGDSISNLKIIMNDNGNNFKDYQYIKISADISSVLYNFYIYPILNNVYECEYKYNTNVQPVSYVPSDIDEIKKTAELSGDVYTYIFEDSQGCTCELRLSIKTWTGIGLFNSLFYGDSSMGKWFMKRTNKQGKVHYYKYYNEGWYYFNEEALLPSYKLPSYWDLDKKVLSKQNTVFWQKWG